MTADLLDTPRSTTLRPAVVYRPESAVFWLYAVALLVGILSVLTNYGQAFHETFAAQLVLAPAWLALMAFLVWLMFACDPFRSVRQYKQGLVAGSALGASTALAMAMQGNDQLGQILARYLEPDIYANWLPALTAPFVEEAAKAMCAAVVLVLCASVFNRISHALLVGMFVGFGFDIAEDLTYATNEAIGSLDSDTSGAGGSLLVRALTAVPAHWAYTGLAAVGVLLLLPTFRNDVGWSRLRRVVVAVALFAGASFMHFVWDGPVLSVWWKFAVNIAVFVTAVLVLLRYERGWVVDRIREGRDAAPLAEVDAAVLDSLPTGRLRRSLRKQARRTGGRTAKKAVAAQQRWALDRIASAEVCAHPG